MVATNYAWDPEFDCITKEADAASGEINVRYTQEPRPYGRLVSQRRGSTTNYYHYDNVGTTRALTNQSQTTTDRKTYTAFGEQVDSSGTTVNSFGFAGETGHYTPPLLGILERQTFVASLTLGRRISCYKADDYGIGNYILLSNSPTIRPVTVLGNYYYMDLNVRPLNRNFGTGRCPDSTTEYFQEWDFEATSRLTQKVVDDTGSESYRESTGNSPCDGYLVQLVTVDCMVDTCGNTLDSGFSGVRGPLTFSYFEAWRVLKGKRVTQKKTVRYTDKASWILPLPSASTQGNCTQAGEIRFYCSKYVPPGQAKTVEDEIKDWRRGGDRYGDSPCELTTGDLRSIDGSTPPNFWSANPWSFEMVFGKTFVRSPAPAHRSFSIEWNCCNCNSSVKVAANPTMDPSPPRQPRR